MFHVLHSEVWWYKVGAKRIFFVNITCKLCVAKTKNNYIINSEIRCPIRTIHSSYLRSVVKDALSLQARFALYDNFLSYWGNNNT